MTDWKNVAYASGDESDAAGEIEEKIDSCADTNDDMD